jgi:YbbR domain-containing protein
VPLFCKIACQSHEAPCRLSFKVENDADFQVFADLDNKTPSETKSQFKIKN